ncbi:MAG: glycoside hydrolase family 2 TIM barrel-domain containing protein, partial [Tepidisphaerales bacterium]
ALYTAKLAFSGECDGRKVSDERSERFGFRLLERDGLRIRVNGRAVFLRGTVDCAVYPRTAHPPVTLDEWRGVFNTIKSYGMNHVRYHTWCPPEAAFAAADELGMYLHVESPYWYDNWMDNVPPDKHPAFGSDAAQVRFLTDEIRRIQDNYGNHPSFVMLVLGNELGSHCDYELLAKTIADARVHDPRHLYAVATARQLLQTDDFFVTHAAGGNAARGAGPGHTNWDFAKAAQSIEKPLIAHETGQYCIFPDFAEIAKYTGPLKPYDLTMFKSRLESAGLAEMNRAFTQASGRWTFLQYREEIEAFLRTGDYAGFQLLSLNDFTGQGNALVGILDPFWETKGICKPEEFRRFCSPTVSLLRFGSRVWTGDQEFVGTAEVAHFGPAALKQATVRWTAKLASGGQIAGGEFRRVDIPVAKNTPIGEIRFTLGNLGPPARINIELRIDGTDIVNDWNIWCYSPRVRTNSGMVIISDGLDESARSALAAGKAVLLIADQAKGTRAAKPQFHSVYWSASMFPTKSATLGLLADPSHPALSRFPTEAHCDYQWQQVCAGATMFNLDGLPKDLKPIVQPIPDFHFIQRLGTVFEARLGKGRLMVCGYNLRDLDGKPARRQLLESLLTYMNSPAFDPKAVITEAQLQEIMGSAEIRQR